MVRESDTGELVRQCDNNGRVSRQSSESEELYRLIAEHSTELISKHTPEGVYTYASPACRSLLGYEPEDLVGHDAYEFFHPEDLHEIRKAHSAILKLPDVYSVACRIRRKDGTYTWFETTSKAIRDEQTGEVKEIIAVSRDATERNRAQEELRYQLELTGTITKNAADALFLLNPEGRITFMNPAAARIFGYRQEELLGEVLHDKVHYHRPDRSPYPLSECPLNMVLTSGQTLHDHEDVFFHKDGSPVFVAYSSASIVIDGQITGLVVVRDVTERKQADEQVRKSSQRIVSILESITEDFYALDTEWRFTYLNEGTLSAIRRAKGEDLKREDLLGKNMWELLPELAGSEFYRKYHEALREQKTVHVEAYSPLRDAWVEVHAYPSEEGLSVYVQDITERKRVEEELRESEKRFRATFEQAAVGIAHNAPGGRWLRVNQKLCDILGYSREELLQKAFQDITHPDDVEPNFGYIRQLLAGDIGSFSMEKRYIRKDGSIVWGNATVSLVRGPSGEPGYSISVVEDITERKQAEEELRFRRALLEAQTETSIDGILVVSSEDEMISYNQRFVEMWNMPEEVLTTRSNEAALEVAKDQAADPQGFMARVNYLYEHPGEESREEIALKDGRTFDRYSAPVTGADGTHYGRVWYFRDITRRKRAEESLLEIREAERRRIARDLHDTVLQDLSGTLQGLQAVQVEFDNADHKADLGLETEALRRAVRGLRDVVHDLRQETVPPFVKAVEALVEYNRQATPERYIRLSVQEDFPQELPEAVKVELLRTVQEALTNVRRHSGARWTSVRLRNSQDGICIEVTDDGRGFNPESVRKGLGLLGMRERIASIGGKLTVRSDTGKGTMVCVTVPAHALAGDEMSRKGPHE